MSLTCVAVTNKPIISSRDQCVKKHRLLIRFYVNIIVYVSNGFSITLQAFLRHVSKLILTKNEASRNSWQQKAQKERNDLHGVVHWASNAGDAVFGVNFWEQQQRTVGKWLSFSPAFSPSPNYEATHCQIVDCCCCVLTPSPLFSPDPRFWQS